MIKKAFLVAVFFTNAIHAMNNITIQPITTDQELQELINLSSKMFDTIYAQDPLPEAQQNYSQNHRKKRLQQLLSIPSQDRNDIFILLNNERIGGVATRQDKKDQTRVIIDKAATTTTDDTTKKLLIGTVMNFIKKTYPNCEKIWTSVQKGNEGSEDQLTKFAGFKESNYMDELHEPQFSQGWELAISRK